MKKFLFMAIGVFMFLCTEAVYAAPTDVGWQQSVTYCVDGVADQPVSQVFAYFDYVIEAPAQATSQVFSYLADPAEVAQPKFNMALPVFRLCYGKSIMLNAYTIQMNRYESMRGLQGCLTPNSRARHVSE